MDLDPDPDPDPEPDPEPDRLDLEIFADSERACQDLQFEILHAKSEKNPVFPVFRISRINRINQIRKFCRILNGLAKAVNLIYYLQKVIFGPGDDGYLHLGAGAGVHLGGGASIFSSSDGQDEAVDTPTMAVGRLGPKSGTDIIPF